MNGILNTYLILQLITFLIEIGLIVNNDVQHNDLWMKDILSLSEYWRTPWYQDVAFALIGFWILPTIIVFVLLGLIGKGLYWIRDKIVKKSSNNLIN